MISDLLVLSRAPGNHRNRLERIRALRSVMAHEYLDLRFYRVTRFVQKDVETVRAVMEATRAWMVAQKRERY